MHWKMREGWFEMTRRTVTASVLAALLLVGCGHAVRDSVKTSGEAAERAVREWERSQSALVLAEDARNAARDAAADAADPPSLGDRDDFIEDRADDAGDRADDAKDRADDARDRAEDLDDRAKDAEEAAEQASEWMADKGFYTREEYWDCNRYRGSEAFEDQPEACEHANEARALASVVRWRANRAQTIADHARALAHETVSLAQQAEAERRTGGRREELLADAEQLRTQAADQLAEVRAAYAEQNREWQQLQARAGGWLEGAERTYAAIKRDDGGGGWMSALVGGAIGAAAGAAGASALGLTGSEALELATVTTVAGAEAAAGGDGTLTQAAVNAVTDDSVAPAAVGTATPADPSLDEALDSFGAGLAAMVDGNAAGAGALDAGARTPEDAIDDWSPAAVPAGGDVAGGDAGAAGAFDALDRAFAAEAAGLGADPAAGRGDSSSDAAVADPFAALDQAFSAEAAGARPEPDAVTADRNPDTAASDAFAALDQAFAAEAAGIPSGFADPAAVGGGDGSAGAARADPFAALDQAFAAERDAQDAEEVDEAASADAEPADAAVEDAFAALDLAFASEAAELSADEETIGVGGQNADTDAVGVDPLAAPEPVIARETPDAVPEDEVAAVVDAGLAPADAAGAEPPATPVLPLDVAAGADAAAEAAAPANLAEWVRAVNAGVRAAEEAADEAEAAASGTGSWFGRTASCVNARDRLSSALARVEELTLGESRPSYVTTAAGKEAYAELGERLEAVSARGRAACETIERPQ